MNSTKDLKTIEDVLSGNTNAFSIIVNDYKDLVFTLCLRLLKDREMAEEISQDVFIKIYSNLKKFKGKSKFSSWVYRITYNACLDELRKQKKKFNEVSISDENEYLISDFDNILHQLESEELTTNIKKCLDLLSGEDSFLLTMFYFDELSLKEISDIVKMKSNTVKVKIHRARQKLMGILKNNIEPEIISKYEKA